MPVEAKNTSRGLSSTATDMYDLDNFPNPFDLRQKSLSMCIIERLGGKLILVAILAVLVGIVKRSGRLGMRLGDIIICDQG